MRWLAKLFSSLTGIQFGTAGEDANLLADMAETRTFGFLVTSFGVLTVLWHTGFTPAAATPLLWALACLASGAAVGFLFGIPKILQGARPTAGEPHGASADTRPYAQRVNTNLEEISDWITKIVVGLGLIQLRQIPPYLYSTAEILARSMGSLPDGDPLQEHTAFALALIIYFAIDGFLFGYLSTRIFLARMFFKAEHWALMEAQAQIAQLQQQVSTLQSNQGVPAEESSPVSPNNGQGI
jgi:hypothetical protein